MAPVERSCGFAIFRRSGENIEYLLMQSSHGKHHWTPPKGHVDPGENDMQTAIRETQEESGYVKEDLLIHENVKKEIVYPIKSGPKTVVYFLAELTNKSKEVRMSSEHQDFKWLTIDEACSTATRIQMEEVLRYFHQYIVENKL